jgi:hypothetical protein
LYILAVWERPKQRKLGIIGYGPADNRFEYKDLQVTPESLSSWIQVDLSSLPGTVEGVWRMEVLINGRVQKNIWFRVGGMGAWLAKQY